MSDKSEALDFVSNTDVAGPRRVAYVWGRFQPEVRHIVDTPPPSSQLHRKSLWTAKCKDDMHEKCNDRRHGIDRKFYPCGCPCHKRVSLTDSDVDQRPKRAGDQLNEQLG